MSEYVEPRVIRRTTIDFSALRLPPEISADLAEAFWSSLSATNEKSIVFYWYQIRTFERFNNETSALVSPSDFTTETITRYIEWLNRQTSTSGDAWTKSSRASSYNAVARLVRWAQVTRSSQTLLRAELPYNPFPWRNRDSGQIERIGADVLRKILRACEKEIIKTRAAISAAQSETDGARPSPGSLQWAVMKIAKEYGGIVPTTRLLKVRGDRLLAQVIASHMGRRQFAIHLHPTADALLPYYLALLIHAAGNPDPIAELQRDCIQDLPLLDDHKALVWFKARSNSVQRRTFRDRAPLGVPSLVRDLTAWSEPLRAEAPPCLRDRLFLYRGMRGVSALTSGNAKKLLPEFVARHGVPRFALAAIRPSVLTSLYRATGDLQTAKMAACHANVATTVKYVQGPLVRAENAERVSSLQSAFLGQLTKRRSKGRASRAATHTAGDTKVLPNGAVVTMFGFDCKDPFSGVAPGSRSGSLCMNYMGCFTCPNAVIVPEPRVIAKLLQARDHLLLARATLHPARWHAVYETQLKILEEDILPRFTEAELSAAEAERHALPPIPDLR